jgi:spore coat polysaccharide biosynthesis protein SpsF
VTGDAPLIHPPLIDALIRRQRETGAEYVVGELGPCIHEGFEVVTRAALLRARAIQTDDRHREHVTLFIRENVSDFHVAYAPIEPRHRVSGARLSVDDPRDLAFMDAVYRRLWRPPSIVDLDDVIDLLAREPALRAINSAVTQKPTSVKSRRIGVRLDAGGTIGLGHLTRCHALAWALREEFHCGVTLLSRSAPGILARFTDDGFPLHRLPDGDDGSREIGALLDAVSSLRLDTLVTDLKTPYPAAIARAIRDRAGRLVAVDDATDARFAADLAVYPNWHADPAIVSDPRWNGTRVLTGAEYVLFRHGIGAEARREPEAADEAARVLVLGGGSDEAGITLRALDALAPLGEAVRVTAVIGPTFLHRDALAERLKTAGGSVDIADGPPDLSRRMATADLAVCAFGVSAYELAYFGVPTLVIAHEPRNVKAAERFARTGTAISLGHFEDAAPERIGDAARRLLADSRTRAAMRARGATLLDGRGARRVAAAIAEL